MAGLCEGGNEPPGSLKATAAIHLEITAVYGNIMSDRTVRRWCREFRDGRTNIHDEERSGRPSVMNDEPIAKETQGVEETNDQINTVIVADAAAADDDDDDDDDDDND
ncbi:hypothetical protein ANN_22227 [Periplaneta americana]|uniref:Mos1 transposase HTH domain-containing protein n=1 Tax=Periplaneta americana TaxID=6978 RepID=A0ABQ8S7J8_PERAM|nr:hypothetical protein ANN_22227 [Periplaneta americana]